LTSLAKTKTIINSYWSLVSVIRYIVLVHNKTKLIVIATNMNGTQSVGDKYIVRLQ
jgi:hypothetical protein